MKKFFPLFTSCLIFLSTGCSNELRVTLPDPIPLVKRNNLYYKVNSEDTFSGTLVVYAKSRSGMGEGDNGKELIMLKSSFANGKLDGKLEEYSKSGQIVRQWEYSDGMFDGTVKNYEDNGQLVLEASFSKDSLNGPITVYYGKTGAKRLIASYKNNVIDGTILTYDDKGVLSDSGRFVQGKAEGAWTYRSKFGFWTPITYICKANFANGSPNGETHFFDVNGKPLGVATLSGQSVDAASMKPAEGVAISTLQGISEHFLGRTANSKHSQEYYRIIRDEYQSSILASLMR